MDTLKTAVVIVLLLAVLYGVYVVLNKPGVPPLPEEFAWPEETPQLQIEMGGGTADGLAMGGGQLPSDQMQAGMPAASAQPTTNEPPQPQESPTFPTAMTAAGSDPPPQLLDDSSAPPLPHHTPPVPDASLAAQGTDSTVGATDLASSTSETTASTDYQPATDDYSSPPAEVGGYGASPASPDRSAAASDISPSTSVAGQYGGQPADGGYGAASTADSYSTAPTVPDNYAPAATATDATPSDGGYGAPVDPTPTTEPPVPSVTPASATENAVASSYFESMLESVKSKVRTGDFDMALNQLSNYYEDPELTDTERQKLLDWLDPLAAKVIYSRDHLLERPHQVQRGENLRGIAQRFSVPWQLLANINGISDPDSDLPPGSQLKVVQGPFRADVSLSRQELTLFRGKSYAGRFPVRFGTTPAPPGEYEVNDKQLGRSSYAPGRPGGARDSSGDIWIDLGGGVSIHAASGTPSPGAPSCIGLSAAGARDVFGILSKGSKVSIRR